MYAFFFLISYFLNIYLLQFALHNVKRLNDILLSFQWEFRIQSSARLHIILFSHFFNVKHLGKDWMTSLHSLSCAKQKSSSLVINPEIGPYISTFTYGVQYV